MFIKYTRCIHIKHQFTNLAGLLRFKTVGLNQVSIPSLLISLAHQNLGVRHAEMYMISTEVYHSVIVTNGLKINVNHIILSHTANYTLHMRRGKKMSTQSSCTSQFLRKSAAPDSCTHSLLVPPQGTSRHATSLSRSLLE